jgi:hypothetical protein
MIHLCDSPVREGRVFSLSVHAEYACRHSGACCTAGWSIPVETHLRAIVPGAWLHPVDGACPEYDRAARRCRIHREHGELMLPDACFHFPRRALIDDRGTFITLTHFCPTAASMLLDDTRPLRVVTDPVAFPPTRRYEGLDARGEWPPLVRPDVLFDGTAYDVWEGAVIAALATPADGPGAVLASIAGMAERIRRWTADAGPLLPWVTHAVQEQGSTELPAMYRPFAVHAAHRLAASCVPDGLEPPAIPDDFAAHEAMLVAPYWDAHSSLLLRYVATKAFASWSAYQGRGVRTQVAEWVLALTVLRVECVRAALTLQRPLDRGVLHAAVRQSDWLLMHLVDRTRLMTALGTVEHHVDRDPEA